MKLSSTMACMVCFVLAALEMSSGALAQARHGVRGKVTDPDGRVVRDVEVQAQRGERTWRVVTDERGEYAIIDLPPGRFRLTFRKNDFADVVEEFELRNSAQRLDVELTIAGRRESPVDVVAPFPRPGVVIRPSCTDRPKCRCWNNCSDPAPPDARLRLPNIRSSESVGVVLWASELDGERVNREKIMNRAVRE